MFNIGIGELIVVFGAVFLLFGPEALPKIARKAGDIFAKLKTIINGSIKDLK